MGTGDRGTDMTKFIKRLLGDRRGATAVEYGLILALIALAAMAAIINVASKTVGLWNNVATIVNGA